MQSSTVLATIQASIRASSIMIYNIMVSILDSSLATLGRVTKQNACNMPSFKPRLVLVWMTVSKDQAVRCKALATKNMAFVK